jgi:ferredoxin
MVSVEWVDRSLELTVAPGDRLLDALDERPQIGMIFGCRSGHCGTCRVRVIEGLALVQPERPAERETLRGLGAHTEERLACQLRIDAIAGRVRLVSVSP